ncbi:hypothetical protein SEA_DRHAYES_97 [Mycobacterium phage DrHayes]|uniref:Uncharacterized protein n=1 Tax=Mycobacterium phage Urkel TaxID=1912978 RepID=A0A1I9S4X8_9CAUD|nr:hypothetical protein I5H07_gp06 [Mycobacterium phage Urkel]AOZ61428.1 hypothetical protein SEA_SAMUELLPLAQSON_97 [Mycobacterium phage SamuelLPlaqson]AOZ61525.1 hypothetical protein SEA_DRHAYES_97 [Mycobacterium phage DrHayes]AOZ61622.1 hypothetical protein SEA_URKEL_97 [Mycobacterium phage Urkel]
MRLSPRRASWVCITDYPLAAMVKGVTARKRYAEHHGERGRLFVFSVGKLLIVWDRDGKA